MREVEFDYPVSPTFRAYEDYLNGGANYTIHEKPVPQEPTDLQPIKNELLYLRNKMEGLQAQRYPKKNIRSDII